LTSKLKQYQVKY